MKHYIGVSSLDKSGIFYFNIHNISVIKFEPVRKNSALWENYVVLCDKRDEEPQKVFVMTVGHGKGQVNFLVNRKKMKDVKHRLQGFLYNLEDIEEEEE